MNMIEKSYAEWLHNERVHERLDNYKVFGDYYNGDQDVNIPKKIKAALESELGTISNFCRQVVDIAVDYITGGTVGIEVKDDETGDAEKALYDVWDNNQLFDEEMIKLSAITGKLGDSFIKLYIDPDKSLSPESRVLIRIIRPELVFPGYRSDDYKTMEHCAIKFFDELDERGARWKAQVFRIDVVEYYELDGKSETEHTQWVLVRTEPNKLGFIPIVHVKNTIDDLEFGVSDLQVMTPLQDALNKTITDMLLTMDQQAFQRMFAWGVQTPKGKKISQAPGTIVESQNHEGHVDVVEAAAIEPYIAALREIKAQISSTTSIPAMLFDRLEGSAALSGLALKTHYHPLEMKCGKKIVILRNRLKQLNAMIFKALAVLDAPDYSDLKTEVRFTSSLPADDKGDMEVIEMELLNRLTSRRAAMQERGVEDVDARMAEIAEEEAADNVNGARVRAEGIDTRMELERFAAGEVEEEV